MPTTTPDEVQIVIPGIPKALVEVIDQTAKKNDRSRAAEVRVWLTEISLRKREELRSKRAA